MSAVDQPSPQLVGGGGEFPGQRRHRLGPRQDRRHRLPAGFAGHHRQQPGPHQRRLPAPRRAHHQQHRTFGALGRGPQQRRQLLDLPGAAEEHPMQVGVERAQPRKRRTGHPANRPRRRRPAAATPPPASPGPRRCPSPRRPCCTAFSSGWRTPGSARTGSSRLPRVCAITSSAVHQAEPGRPRSAGTPPRRPSAAAHAAAAPTPPPPRCRRADLIQEHLVAVADQPPVHLTGRAASSLAWLTNTLATAATPGLRGRTHPGTRLRRRARTAPRRTGRGPVAPLRR